MKVRDKKIVDKMKRETKRAVAHVTLLEKLYLNAIKKNKKKS